MTYRAQWGQTVCVIGQAQPNNTWTEQSPLTLSCTENEHWSAQIAISDFAERISYRYAIRNSDGTYTYEAGKVRNINLHSDYKNYSLCDAWQASTYEDAFFSTTFMKSLFVRTNPLLLKETKGNVHFRLLMPQVEPTQGIAIVGNIPELGNWDDNRKVMMSDTDFPTWSVELDIANPNYTIEYKYVVYELASGRIVDYEEGENRRLHNLLNQDKLICSDVQFRRSQARWKGAGVAIPVFSIRTLDGFGVGEFLDLKQMADWCVTTGQKMIQTLPINDTTLLHTNRDSYPYNAVSVFALNPIYLNIERMGTLRRGKKAFEATKAEFNAKNFVDYQIVVEEKWKYFKQLYKQEHESVFSSADYKAFFAQNEEWLVPYAVFCYLRDKFGTPQFGTWAKHSTYDKESVAQLADPASKTYDKIAIHYYLQFHLDRQLREAIDYAHSVGVAMKGDIPIGISPDSVEAWTNPELFNLATQAGAPPDDFSPIGQNWGFPTYNWDIMEKDNFSWWGKRFGKMADYFDAYRIDHILGFFRIWEMPKQDVWGLNGSFSPALPYSMQDLRNAGIHLDLDRMTKPYIRANFLGNIFGEHTEQVKETYLLTNDTYIYYFKPEYDTQRKIADHFAANKMTSETDQFIMNGLLYLHCEVLMVHDLHQPELLHPRIALYQSYSYQELDNDLQHRLNDLHNHFFYERHNEFWKQSALRKLPTLISVTDMLVCGEDLGMVPATVPDVMNGLQILSLEIQRMPKDPTIEFFHPNNAPYLSVCTTGTHDMNPLRAWWEEDRDVTQRYYNQIMGWWGEAHHECTPEIASTIIDQHIYSKAMWVILPLQDWLACSADLRFDDQHGERINCPDNPHHFWCYRMHLTMEDLLRHQGFNNQIRQALERARR